MWVSEKGHFSIATSCRGEKNYYNNVGKWVIGKKHNIMIQQYDKYGDGKLYFEIFLDGVAQHSVYNYDPRPVGNNHNFRNVQVWVSDMWYWSFNSQYGKVENLKWSKCSS